MSFRQGFAYWAFVEEGELDRDLLRAAAGIGLRGVDFLPEPLWSQARDLGLELVVMDGHVPLESGFIDPERHAGLADQVRRSLEVAAIGGVRHVTVAAGNRGPGTPSDGVSACVEGLAPLAREAESAGVGLLLEPLNTKVDHAGHECATTAWAAEVVRRVGSPALRILYDFYHAQVMEGDLLRTVAANLDLIGHFHTAGVPGRGEIGDGQEVNYRAIGQALRTAGYDGYVCHEFIPQGDKVAALKEAHATLA